MELSEELIAKAKGTKTPEELAALAKESSIDLTEEEAKAYFEQLHPKTGELSDDELDNVAGGGCHTKGGYLLTTAGYRCGFFEEDTSPTAFGLMGTCCRCRHLDRIRNTRCAAQMSQSKEPQREISRTPAPQQRAEQKI